MAYTPLSAFSLDELKKEYEELYPKDKLEKNMDNRVLRPEEAKEYDDTIETMTYLLDQRYKSYKSFNGIMVKNIEKTPDRVEILLDVINEVDTTSEEGFEESLLLKICHSEISCNARFTGHYGALHCGSVCCLCIFITFVLSLIPSHNDLQNSNRHGCAVGWLFCPAAVRAKHQNH